MAVIDPEGFFNGDRLRRCSIAAQLHWPRLFLASDGFARIEINCRRIVGRAYATFDPAPADAEIESYICEYWQNYMLFLYRFDGQLWGQWDTRSNLLPTYKTAIDRRSPPPPELNFIQWKRRYREESKSLPKVFQNLPESFFDGIGVGGVDGADEGEGDIARPAANRELVSSTGNRPPARRSSPVAKIAPEITPVSASAGAVVEVRSMIERYGIKIQCADEVPDLIALARQFGASPKDLVAFIDKKASMRRIETLGFFRTAIPTDLPKWLSKPRIGTDLHGTSQAIPVSKSAAPNCEKCLDTGFSDVHKEEVCDCEAGSRRRARGEAA